MNTMRNRYSGAAITVALSAVVLTGCGSSGSSSTPDSTGAVIPTAWYSTVDEQFEKAGDPGSVPTIDLDADCALDASVQVDGKKPETFGAGASSVGDTGRRYQCDFRKPSSHLVVVKFTDEADYTEAADDLKADSQPGNEQTEESFTVNGRTIKVVRIVYPTNDSHIDYEASVVDPAGKAYAVLDIETTDELKTSYTSRQAADDFSKVLDG